MASAISGGGVLHPRVPLGCPLTSNRRKKKDLSCKSPDFAPCVNAAKTLLVTVCLELSAKRTIRLRVPYTEL